MNRSATDCAGSAGVFRPEVDPRRCEGKAECVRVCPYGVFAIGVMPATTLRALPLLIKLKVWLHGKKLAHTPAADACHACGLCVAACPERAIRLIRTPISDASATPPAESFP